MRLNITISLLFISSFLFSQIQYSSNVGGGLFNQLESNGENLFAATSSGLYKIDNDSLWEEIYIDHEKELSIRSLSVLDEKITIVGSTFDEDAPQKIFHSENTGKDWLEITVPDSLGFIRYLRNYKNGIIVSAYGNIYNYNLTNKSWSPLEITSSAIENYHGKIHIGHKEKILQMQNDDPNQWIEIECPITVNHFFVHDSIIIVGDRDKFRISYDSGNSWLRLSPVVDYDFDADFVKIGDRIYIQTQSINSFKIGSTNVRAEITSDLFKGPSYYFRCINKIDSILVAGSSVSGAYLSFDGGKTWQSNNRGIKGGICDNLIKTDKGAAGLSPYHGIQFYDKSTDTWALDNSYYSLGYLSGIEYFNEKIVTFNSRTKDLIFSSDHGMTWDTINNNQQPPFGSHIHNYNNNWILIYNPGFTGLYFSKVTSEPINAISDFQFSNSHSSNPEHFITSSNRYLFVANYDGLYKSKGLFDDFEMVMLEDQIGEFNRVQSVFAEGDSLVAAIVLRENQEERLIISEDIGETWKETNLRINYNDPVRRSIVEPIWDFTANENFYFLIIRTKGAYVSLDKGENWISLKGNLGSKSPTVLEILEDRLLIGTNDIGVWQVLFEDLNGISSLNNQPTIQNFQVHPNPNLGKFNLTVNDDFMDADLKVFGLDGNLLFSQKVTSKNIQINLPPYLSNGVYLMTLQKDSKMGISKILIQKN